jgi:hypothetical protein
MQLNEFKQKVEWEERCDHTLSVKFEIHAVTRNSERLLQAASLSETLSQCPLTYGVSFLVFLLGIYQGTDVNI